MKYPCTGAEDFKEVRETYYYVDKTALISHILHEKVTLLTRPRRFGKTLNMSMLKYFYDIEEDSHSLFDGLDILHDAEAMKEMNQYPVIFLSLKKISGRDFNTAIEQFKNLIFNYMMMHSNLLESEKLNEIERQLLERYATKKEDLSELQDFFLNIAIINDKLYKRKTIVLIDEYDVPLNSAYQHGYYDEMTDFFGAFLGNGLKTNDFLYKAVLSGCLRISKESIFTGLNNFRVRSIFDLDTAEDFGFTSEDIDQMLKYYHLENKKAEIERWYDGYRFGDADIYNPWSTSNYIFDVFRNDNARPVAYWANSSGNDIVYSYIQKGGSELHHEFEKLTNGDTLVKPINGELTYREMDDIDNICSFLLFTGYLKPADERFDHTYELKIPNREVLSIYQNQFEKWFNDYTRSQSGVFVSAIMNGDEGTASRLLGDVLSNSVSSMDTKESFYHGMLIGMLSGNEYLLTSNRESGDGRFDVCLRAKRGINLAALIECKVAHSDDELDFYAEKAIRQIETHHYDQSLKQEGYSHIIKYGIAFYKKKARLIKHND